MIYKNSNRRQRASASGRVLNEDDVAIIKGMLARGDRQHDIAAVMGCNAGRIGEIATGAKYANVPPAHPASLPQPYDWRLHRLLLGETREADFHGMLPRLRGMRNRLDAIIAELETPNRPLA